MTDDTHLGLPVGDHDMSHGTQVTSVRSFDHGGKAVEIAATYEVKVNGVARQLHFSVGQDGKVTSHLRPYVAYDSLVDMVKDIIDLYPDDFGPAPQGGHGDHHGHGG